MYKNCVLFFSAAGYHSRNDSAENSKYIWKTYGIKKLLRPIHMEITLV